MYSFNTYRFKIKVNHLNPLFKKGAKDFAYKKFTNLQLVSKITERAVFVCTHVMNNQLFPELQSPHRMSHSPETVLVKIVNDILLDMNCQHESLLVLLDLNAAFDTVDHTTLLRRLETSFDTADALTWFSSYLPARSQRAMINGVLSDIFDLTFGVNGHALHHFCYPLMREGYSTLSRTIQPYLSLSFEQDSSMGDTEARCAIEI